MPTDYTLSDLAKLSGVSPRTVRYYIQSGLLPAPTGAGPAARYTESHLDRLRLIRKLQNGHLPLSEIRRRLESMPDKSISAATDSIADQAPEESALDYVSSLLNRHNEQLSAVPLASLASAAPPPPATGPPPPAPALSVPATQAASGPAPEPERAQWERIALDPDIEIHVRRPLSRLQNKRVERLVSIARQLLEED